MFSHGEARASEPLYKDPQLLREAVDKARKEFGIPSAAVSSPKPAARRSEASGKHRLVKIERQQEVVAARSELPIIGMEQEIVEAVLESDIIVLSGETGCGKTTQVTDDTMTEVSKAHSSPSKLDRFAST